MAAITREQIKEIRTLTRRANRRIERATPGQRKALEYYIKKYTGATKFSAATKGLTGEAAAKKLADLNRFLAGESSTRRGWDRLKQKNVENANKKLRKQGYNLTDEELAELLEQIDTKNRNDYYKAVNLVEAAKLEAIAKQEAAEQEGEELEAGTGWEGSSEDIAAAIAEKVTYQEALAKAIMARNKRNKQNAKR